MRRVRCLLLKLGKVHYLFSIACLLFVVFVCKQVLDKEQSSAATQKRRFVDELGNPSYLTKDDLVYYRRDIPLIWIGGVPRSGTTLMRVMLDAHPDVRCGTETRVIPRMLNMYQNMEKADFEMAWLKDANLTNETLENALGAYILSVIANHGEPAPRLCNKDPFTMRSMQRLLRIFPNSRFVLMIRDARATVHSIISRKVTIRGFDFNSYRGALLDWNRVMSTMYSQCLVVGPGHCLPVYYEQLVSNPEKEMREILEFQAVDWNSIVLRHETTLGQKRGVFLSKREFSFDQVNKPVNTEALTRWVEHIPPDIRKDMRSLAPMLETLGYDPDAYPPDYSLLQNAAKKILKQTVATVT